MNRIVLRKELWTKFDDERRDCWFFFFFFERRDCKGDGQMNDFKFENN